MCSVVWRDRSGMAAQLRAHPLTLSKWEIRYNRYIRGHYSARAVEVEGTEIKVHRRPGAEQFTLYDILEDDDLGEGGFGSVCRGVDMGKPRLRPGNCRPA